MVVIAAASAIVSLLLISQSNSISQALIRPNNWQQGVLNAHQSRVSRAARSVPHPYICSCERRAPPY